MKKVYIIFLLLISSILYGQEVLQEVNIERNHIFEGNSWFDRNYLNENITISLDIPLNWHISSTIFWNEINQKVGEILGIVKLYDESNFPPSLEELLSIDEEEGIPTNYLEFSNINLLNSEGILIVQKTNVYDQINFETITWYPHIYFLKIDSYALGLLLITTDPDLSNRVLFDRIANSVSLSSGSIE